MPSPLRLMALAGMIALSSGLRAVPPAAEIKRVFEALDTSQNDAIGLAEWEPASFALFKSADTNRDNFLTREEIGPGSASLETFLTADTNQDSKLSIGEFMTLRRAIFRAADLNRDDFLEINEYEIFHVLAQAGWNDRNKNGRLDPNELKAALTLAFEQLDTDKNGALDAVEGAFLSPTHRAEMELSGGGRVTLESFIAGYFRFLTG